MAVNFKKARDFVYANGQIWERALFAYLFQNGSLSHVHDCLRVYRNPDGGYAHALEQDIRTPSSHPLALEYLLRVLHDTKLPAGDLLDGTTVWVENNQNEDGSLKNPDDLLDYPHAPWWDEGGQDKPDSIVGLLLKEGKATPKILEKTRAWVKENLSLEHIIQEEWLFMMYHAFDYFLNDKDFPNVAVFQDAIFKRIIELSEKLPENQAHSFFTFVHHPDSAIAKLAPELLNRYVDLIEPQQRDDGSWIDQHNLQHWSSYLTILMLQRLKAFGRW